MPITLPLLDAFIDDVAPLYEPGQDSLTQCILEKVMLADFPKVATLGIEYYCERLLQVTYTDGTQVFYLDWNPPLPGYVVVFMEPWTSSIDDTGEMVTDIKYYSGPTAAKKAEEVRRLIPPGETHN